MSRVDEEEQPLEEIAISPRYTLELARCTLNRQPGLALRMRHDDPATGERRIRGGFQVVADRLHDVIAALNRMHVLLDVEEAARRRQGG